MALVQALGGFEGMRGMRERKDVLTRHFQFDRALRQLINAKGDGLPRDVIPELFAHWGDPINRSGESYIRSCLAHVENSTGHILQCGANLTTLLLGVLCTRLNREDKRVWCLADDTHWANVIRSWLTQYGITHTHVIVSPPQLYDNYVWYGVDPKQFPKDFALALCTGGSARVTGAIGLVERMPQRMSEDCVLLAQQVVKAADQRHLHDWAKSKGLGCVLVDKKEGFLKVAKQVNQDQDRYSRLPG